MRSTRRKTPRARPHPGDTVLVQLAKLSREQRAPGLGAVPALAAYAGRKIVRMDFPLFVSSKLRLCDSYRVAFEAVTEFMVAHVEELARMQPQLAGEIAGRLQVPVVRASKEGFLVSRVRLSEVIARRAAEVGEAAGRSLARRIERVADAVPEK